ncbi:MAG: hypothetical protein C0591_11815 [Marinilabiliales bacterium]|nr:MAG: hypothetical protein C0591_11815 [Marinilabiliales bacterium]
MKNLVIILVVVLISASSYGIGKKHSYSDTTFNNIEFEEITFILDKRTQDTLQIEGLLKQKTFIDGIPCYGSISFHMDWRLKNFTLAGDHIFGNHLFPKDTYVGICIDRFSLEAGHFKTIGGDTVNTCRFKSNQIINGLTCDGEEVIFTTEWNLRACILSDDDTIAGNLIEKGTLAKFDENGSIWIYCLYDPIIQGHHCLGTNYKFWMGGGGICFYPNGQLKYFRPVDDVEVQGVWCRSSSMTWGISLYESGKLMKCSSAKDQTIGGVFYTKKTTLEFDEDGNVINSK